MQLKDVAQLWCSDPAAVARLNALTIKTIRKDRDFRYVESVLDLLPLIRNAVPSAQVTIVGQVNYIIDYHRPKKENYAWEWLKTGFVCLVCFFGAALCHYDLQQRRGRDKGVSGDLLRGDRPGV